MSMTATFTNRLVLIVLTSLFLTGIAHAQGKSVVKKEFKKVKFVPTSYIDAAGELFTKDDSYVKIMRQDTLAIPYLIDKLNDTTLTTISCHLDNYKLRRGDIALFLINDIESIPVDVVTNTPAEAASTTGIFPDGFFNNFREKRVEFQERYRRYYYSDARRERIHQVH